MNELKYDEAVAIRKEMYDIEKSFSRKNNKKLEPWSLTILDIMEFIPVSRSTLERWMKIGYFPCYTRLFAGKARKPCRYWNSKDVILFLDKCISNKNSYKDHMESLKTRSN